MTSGRWGPCCSTAPTGWMTTDRSLSAVASSGPVSSAYRRSVPPPQRTVPRPTRPVTRGPPDPVDARP